jgi:hypothetical protein
LAATLFGSASRRQTVTLLDFLPEFRAIISVTLNSLEYGPRQ